MEDKIKSFIAEWLSSQLPRVIERDFSLPLDKDYIVTVTGGRRNGKTFLLFPNNFSNYKKGISLLGRNTVS